MTDEMYNPQSFLGQSRQQNQSISGSQLGNSSYFAHNQNSSGHNSHFENSSSLVTTSPQNNHTFGSYRNARIGNEENHADSSQNSINDPRFREENGIDRVEILTNDIRKKLIEEGHFERLREHVESRLSEVGWRLGMVAACQEIIEKEGPSITFDQLYGYLESTAKKSVPNEVKEELIKEIKNCYVGYSKTDSD